MLTTTASYLAVTSNIARTQNSIAAEPIVQRATQNYLTQLKKITSVSDFVNNYAVFSYAMKAFGLGDLTYAKGLMTKVLQEGITDKKALANTLSDTRYKAFATAFDFVGKGAAAVTGSKAATTDTTAKYVEQILEDTQGQQNQGVQLALYFRRVAPTITTTYGLLADPAVLKVVQTVFDIPASSGLVSVDAQARYLGKVLPIKDLQDPAKVQRLVERFTAEWDARGIGPAPGPPANALLVSSSPGAGLSTDLLVSIAGLRTGGA